MFTYGWKWQQSLQKILKRLALNEGDGFLVLEGPDGSGKTDLIKLVKEIISKPITDKGLSSEAILHLAELVHSKQFLLIDIGTEEVGFHSESIPMAIFENLAYQIHTKGIPQGCHMLIVWDDIDKSFQTHHEQTSKDFLEQIHRPLKMYEYLTFLCTVTSNRGNAKEILGITAGIGHFLKL
jgi:energy-coupling factor transporter ATP-binding protein EcfA2